ncbi:MAG: VanW family protein [Defluviitaleaceae bacterium]|nr:VanW family protein [Defluviitaleaceae bacterium]
MKKVFMFTGVTFGILIVAAAAILSGLFISAGDVIFPNVSVQSVNLSGMTPEEAVERLTRMGFENNAETVSVTVNFPDGSGFSLSGNDAGLSLCAEEAVLAAFRHGRYGSFFERAGIYATSLMTPTNIIVTPVLDENFIRNEVAIHTQNFNSALVENTSYSLDEYSLTIIRCSGFEPASEDSVFSLVAETFRSALEENAHLVAYYTPPRTEPVAINLDAIYYNIRTEPVSAFFDPETFVTEEDVLGVGFDLASAMTLLSNSEPGEQIVIPLIFTEPDVTAEYLRERLFRDELAVRTTNVSGTAARFHNVTLAASFIDGMILYPGDIFSFNQTVPRRTAAIGFRPAGGFRDGQLVDMIGGGICQVSSSLYDNLLHAHIEVLARRAHSLPIAYLPLGHDAAIYYGVLDLRFRNNTDYPIRIEIEFDERNMTTRLIGTRTNDYVTRIESRSSAVPFQTIYRESANWQYEGQIYFRGANGAVAYTTRIVYNADGEEISRTHIARDVYRAQNRIVLIPPPGAAAMINIQDLGDVAPEPPPAF